MGLKAIETVYNGYRFRSRLEARWAVFFDALGLAYRYEDQGYDIGGKWYLPDFWIPALRGWVEIKGQAPTKAEGDLAYELAQGGFLSNLGGQSVYILFGSIQPPPYEEHGGYVYAWSETDSSAGLSWDNYQWWCQCPQCGAIGLTYEGRVSRLACGCVQDDHIHHTESSPLLSAYAAARQARFEHGETPDPKRVGKEGILMPDGSIRPIRLQVARDIELTDIQYAEDE
jgi:hypothetical protein